MPEPTPTSTSTPESSAVPEVVPTPESSAVPTPAPAPESSAVPTPAPTRESEAGTVVATPAPGGGRLRRSVLGPLTAAVVLAAAAGGWYASGGGSPAGAAVDGTGEAVAPVARSLRLPWPDEGQASVAVEGIGSLGTRGSRSRFRSPASPRS